MKYTLHVIIYFISIGLSAQVCINTYLPNSSVAGYKTDIALADNGDLYVNLTNQYKIIKIDPLTGNISTVAGTGQQGYSGDGGPATVADIGFSRSLEFGPDGNLYFAEHANNRIRMVDLNNNIISTVVGNGTSGYSGDGGSATAASISWPVGMVWNSAGDLIFVDSNNNRVRKVDQNGIIQTIYSQYTFILPQHLAIDNDTVYIGDWLNYQIKKIEPITNQMTVYAGNGTKGYSGDGGQVTMAQINPYGEIIFDPNGNMVFAQTSNSVVRKIDRHSGVITTVAGNGSYGYSGDGFSPTEALLSSPIGLAINSSNQDLLIGDWINEAVRIVGSYCLPSCPDDFANGGLNLSQAPLSGLQDVSVNFVANGDIISDQRIGSLDSLINVTYNSSNDIYLHQGFEIYTGVMFHALQEGCP